MTVKLMAMILIMMILMVRVVVVTISRGVVSAAPAPHLRFERFGAVCTSWDFGRCRELNNLIIGNPYFMAVLLCIYSTTMQGVMLR